MQTQEPANRLLRRRIHDGEALVGGWVDIPHPAVARIIAQSGCDWVALDLEHGTFDLSECLPLIREIEASGAAPWVRLPGNDYAANKRFLDAGAQGLIAPLIKTREHAEDFVRSAKYPPDGDRGVGFCAANNYGFDFDDYLARANDTVVCCVQIEHRLAFNNIEAILTVPGIDAAFIGPYDLTTSMGIPGQFDHPDYLRALDRFLDLCALNAVAPGIHVIQPDPDEAVRRIEEGYRLIAYSVAGLMLGAAARDGIARVRERI